MNTMSGPLRKHGEPDKLKEGIAPSLERRRLRAYTALMVLDSLLIVSSFILAALLYEGVWFEPRSMLAAYVLLPIFFTIALYNSTYSAAALERWGFAARKALTALVISAALMNFIAFYTKSNAEFSRAAVSLGLLFSAAALFGSRRLLVLLIAKFWQGRIRNRLVIIDGGPDFAPEGAVIVDAAESDLKPSGDDPYMLDRLGRLLRNQDQVVISCADERRADWALLLRSVGAYGEIVAERAHMMGAIGVNHYADQEQSTFVVSNGPLRLRARIAKRGLDLTIAGFGVILLSPLLATIAVLIKLEDGGPILFAQDRLGRGHLIFRMLKFRSMRVETLDAQGARSTMRDDGRITRIGAFIRRTSLDELPQLINVLRGEMSIVGPRPHALGSRANDKFFWEVDAQYWLRHSLKPGLTGLAQVRGHRGATQAEKDLTDRLSSDLEYIAHWSVPGDIKIVLRTLSVLRHDNAY